MINACQLLCTDLPPRSVRYLSALSVAIGYPSSAVVYQRTAIGYPAVSGRYPTITIG